MPASPIQPLLEAEAALCKTRDEWARIFIARNKDAHPFDVIGAYNVTDLGERLGYFSLEEIESIQIALGAAGLTPEKIAARDARSRKRREEREARCAQFLQMSGEDLLALSDRNLLEAIGIRLLAREIGSSAPTAAFVVSVAIRVNGDVCNGGFDQLFWNADLEEIVLAPEAFAAIGAAQTARVVTDAIALARRKRLSRGRRASGKSGRDHDFDPLDEACYAALPRDTPRSFQSLIAVYARTNIVVF
jgi:hypothetical protein